MRVREGRPIALIGLMGAGKSAVAPLLAVALGASAVDLDERIEATTGRTIREWFESEGEPAFRVREREALAQTLDSGAHVLACGGGIVTDAGSVALLRGRCRVVWLDVSPGEAARRLGQEAAVRPLLAGEPVESRLTAIHVQRERLYNAVAHDRIVTDGRTAAEVARDIVARLGAA